jgi:hypothetical protein
MSLVEQFQTAHIERRIRLSQRSHNAVARSKPTMRTIEAGPRIGLHFKPLPLSYVAPKMVPLAEVVKIAEETIAPVRRRIRVGQVVRAVAKNYGIRPEYILSPCRTADLVRPRQIAMYLCAVVTGYSLPAIGRFMKRDHTTVLHGRDKIRRLMIADVELAERVEALRAEIQSRF